VDKIILNLVLGTTAMQNQICYPKDSLSCWSLWKPRT